MRKRCALITGGSGGIGRALCADLVDAGLRVYSVDWQRPAEPLRGVVYLVADITDGAQLKKALSRVRGPVDILINNAGVMRRGTIFDSSEEDYDLLFGVNLKGSWLMIKHAESVLSKKAMVVQMSSRHGTTPEVDPALYSITKQAGMCLADLLQKTRPGYDVRIVCPGPVDTGLMRYGKKRTVLKRVLRRALEPERFAGLVMRFLCSKKRWLLFDQRKWTYYMK